MDYFTADNHFSHHNIIEICNRPFKNIHKMENVLIDRYNERVTNNDTCYFIGDFYWGRNVIELERIVKRLNGKKHLILGNHDKLNPFDYVNAGFLSVHTALDLSLEFHKEGDRIRNNFILCHDPCAAITNKNRIWIGGHLHNLTKAMGNFINAGVDVWDYKPVSLEEIDTFLITRCLENNLISKP
jgi:calcineurin-like phosphoesterase family protein